MKNKLLSNISLLFLILSAFSLTSAVTEQVDSVSPAKNDSSKSSSMARAIDTSVYGRRIALATKIHKRNPQKSINKKKLAQAYADRGFALIEAAQYKSALGDFRKCLKLDPKNKEAKLMRDQIIDIYKSLNREPPKAGEEPPPIPFKKNLVQ